MTIETLDQPDERTRSAVRALQEAAAAADGTAPFSEQVQLSWSPDPPVPGVRHLLARTATGLPAGYAYLEPGGGAEFAVLPALRRQGHGRALLGRLEAEAAELSGAVEPHEASESPADAVADGASRPVAGASGSAADASPPAADASPPAAAGSLRIWSHGDRPEARALAAVAGYRVVRELLQLRRTSDADPAPAGVDLPAGIAVRAFRPGLDDAAWLALNARAFAHHPEQGRMAQADLDARMAEPWFDPAGFLLAEQDGVLIGFHWTKVHPEGLGEVYALGVDPDRHGSGLGRALTLAGLRSLHGRGLRTVLLYVEADNAPALAVYHRAGFTTWSRDVMYAAAR